MSILYVNLRFVKLSINFFCDKIWNFKIPRKKFKGGFSMKAMKIKMKRSCEYSRNVRDIDSIYLDSIHAYWKKAQVHDYLKENPKSIQVNIFPYPSLIPVVSSTGEKYVRSEANDTTMDNLLRLPRE